MTDLDDLKEKYFAAYDPQYQDDTDEIEREKRIERTFTVAEDHVKACVQNIVMEFDVDELELIRENADHFGELLTEYLEDI